MSARRWFDELYPVDASLVILHPSFANQHLLIPTILNRTDAQAIFVGLRAQQADLGAFMQAITESIQEQTGMVGAAGDSRMTPRTAAQHILKTLHPLGAFTLYLDGFDLVHHNPAITAWGAALVRELPHGSQLVLGTRLLPLALLEDQAVLGKTQLYPCDPDRMLLDYVSQPSDRVLLEVYGQGPGYVLVNGRPVEHWDGILPRALFFYFVDRGMVTREEIFRTFWPTLPIREATNVFHVTKRKISEILGFDLTVYWAGFYRISPQVDLHYDVVKFAESVQNSTVADAPTAKAYLQRAIDLYHGTFLSGLKGTWLDSRREDLRATYVDALSGLARLHEQDGNLAEALGLYMRAASHQPHREDLARAIMTLYDRLGQPERSLEVYERLARELKASLNVTPDRRTTELASQIRAAR